MKKHKFDVAARDADRYVCSVGYDRAHDSYFVYVARRLKEEDGRIVADYDGHPVLWRGIRHQEIDSVEDLARLLAPYAKLPSELSQPLRDLRLRAARSADNVIPIKPPLVSANKASRQERPARQLKVG